jgi:thiamine-phosphate pyrophosphorylase
MVRRHTLPTRWFIADKLADIDTVRRLPVGCGVLVLGHGLYVGERRRLIGRIRKAGAARRLAVVVEDPRKPLRVHAICELRSALLRHEPLILLSPIYPTRSHPSWKPIARMRAAALARLGGRRLFALGGMDEHRFRRIARLGFVGWVGISAWSRA